MAAVNSGIPGRQILYHMYGLENAQAAKELR